MATFAERIITWQKAHGRHDLPWQYTHDPYAVWVSEIMLQQTQVAAVIDYYQRFMQHFPDIASLASADQEEVMRMWSGLGYYSRARNLHAAAQIIVENMQGRFPENFETILTLPGIGRSTAAAISTFAFNQPHPILDGNVKRVFARHFHVEGWPGLPAIEKQLWAIAERENPYKESVAYTQGLMDLGATICTRSRPKCPLCPISSTCKAVARDLTAQLPTPKPKKNLPQKEAVMLILLKGHEVLLQKRPQNGIWGGLWSLPEIESRDIPTEVALQRYGIVAESEEPLPIVQHAFSHYKLAILPQPLSVIRCTGHSTSQGVWMFLDDAVNAAIPSPVRRILLSLDKQSLYTKSFDNPKT